MIAFTVNIRGSTQKLTPSSDDASTQIPHAFSLRHSRGPFIAFGIPFVGIALLVLAVRILRPAQSPAIEVIFELAALALFYAWITSFFWRYRIRFDGDSVTEHAAGLAPINIALSNIRAISYESSPGISGVVAGRPKSRITLHMAVPHGVRPYIDISVRHFIREDIGRLMLAIQSARPDLEIPRPWR
jgi:hypothetical protein